MHRGYNIVAVTPAGRRRYLEILCRHTLVHADILDRHHLWMNTNDEQDLEYMDRLVKTYPFFKPIYPSQPVSSRPAESIYQFFEYCTDENTIYIRLDDDICYICPDAIRKLVDYRIDYPNPFLVYPIIVCNGMEWVLESFKPVAQWVKGADSTLEHIRRHVEFLSEPCSKRYRCDPYIIPYDMNISVNCICWTGRDFKEFGGIVPPWPVNEEVWLSNTKPAELQRPNHITGDGVMVHFSYSYSYTMDFLEKNTNLYQRYFDLAQRVYPEFDLTKQRHRVLI